MRIMKVSELSTVLKKSPSTIYRLVKSNKIPFVKVGGEYLFDFDLIWCLSSQCPTRSLTIKKEILSEIGLNKKKEKPPLWQSDL